MRNLHKLTIFIILITCIIGIKHSRADSDEVRSSDPEMQRQEVKEKVKSILEQEKIPIRPNPQRIYCAKLWNVHYKNEGEDIEVLTRGKYDQVVIFRCPDCSLEKEFVDPFLFSEVNGKTGMDRIKECGYLVAVFAGARGFQEIVREVPQ